MTRLRLTVAYDGTHFCGWQLQAPGLGRTVQGCLEEALARLCGGPVRVHGAGRTDAGVHALAQTAHVDVPDDRLDLPWQRALTALLPRDVAVIQVTPAAPDFHARFWARGKTYAYTLWTRPDYLLPWRRPYVWNVGRHGPLDTAAMDAAARLLVGEHDFAAFRNAGSSVAGTVRRVTAVTRHPGPDGLETVWRFSAPGFLKQMVRNMMGALVAVGHGRITPEAIGRLLAGGARAQAPATAPASGLCLERVHYDDEAGRDGDARRPLPVSGRGDSG
jgi:tRNA pseudouridine38-40 synthase